jgi:hypothetical protein
MGLWGRKCKRSGRRKGEFFVVVNGFGFWEWFFEERKKNERREIQETEQHTIPVVVVVKDGWLRLSWGGCWRLFLTSPGGWVTLYVKVEFKLIFIYEPKKKTHFYFEFQFFIFYNEFPNFLSPECVLICIETLGLG